MSNYNNITVTEKDRVAVLTFNRPQVLNAMNREMMDEIVAALSWMNSESDRIRVAVITGNGRAFMAGADIKEYAAQSQDQFQWFQQKGREIYRLIETSDIPFIAAVNGIALGGGLEIALSCDLLIAADTAKMGLPEVHLGLIPGGGGTHRLLERIGKNRVKEMLLLGQSYTAAQLYEWGLVNVVADETNFMDAVFGMAEKLKRRPAQSLTAFKRMLEPSAAEERFEDRLTHEDRLVTELFNTTVAQELIHSFTIKNKA
jgi:enoyl-CoA hydratase/carnithine racemase